ncbi:MAG: coiled-coil domain-containing protein [Candidatus Hermodarchaeia archaeon]
MQNKLTLHKVIKLQFFCSLLVIIMMLTVISTACAADSNTEIPLKVKGVEGEIALSKNIKVQVENLEKWVEDSNHQYSEFILYVDGNALNGLVPTLIDNDTKLRYDLKRTPESKDAWTAILSRRPKRFTFTRDVPVTVRQEGVKVQGSAQATLIVINRVRFWIFVVVFAAAIALFLGLAYKSDVIREPGPQPSGNGPDGKPKRKQYSLARTQMAFWFFIVTISYVFIWMVTSDLSNLTPSVLALIGISAATGLSSAVVDSNKLSELKNELRPLEKKKDNDEDEKEKLQREIATLKADINATTDPAKKLKLTAELDTKEEELVSTEKEIEQAKKEIDAAKPEPSKHFIYDILSDEHGISFHRFQMFVWTLVLIVIFISQVYNYLAMPDFDTTLLALMGISGGTYVGFKLPKQQG